MAFAKWRYLVCAGILAFGTSANSAPQQEGSGSAGTKPPTAPTDGDAGEVGTKPPTAPTDEAGQEGAKSPDSSSEKPDRSLHGRFRALFSQEKDPDGFISTDRPTFTPANTVVVSVHGPKYRCQLNGVE
jgi:hypothetical protein